jgi:hypothetical protein
MSDERDPTDVEREIVAKLGRVAAALCRGVNADAGVIVVLQGEPPSVYGTVQLSHALAARGHAVWAKRIAAELRAYADSLDGGEGETIVGELVREHQKIN